MKPQLMSTTTINLHIYDLCHIVCDHFEWSMKTDLNSFLFKRIKWVCFCVVCNLGMRMRNRHTIYFNCSYSIKQNVIIQFCMWNVFLFVQYTTQDSWEQTIDCKTLHLDCSPFKDVLKIFQWFLYVLYSFSSVFGSVKWTMSTLYCREIWIIFILFVYCCVKGQWTFHWKIDHYVCRMRVYD